ERFDAEMIHDAQQRLGLIVARDARELRTGRRSRALAAAAEEIEAEDAESFRIERPACACDLGPPPRARVLRSANAAIRRDSAERTHDGRRGRSCEAPRNTHSREPPTVTERDLPRHFQDSFAHERAEMLA